MIAGTLFAALGVILGAFAAHGLSKVLPPEKIEVFQKGVTYQFYHAFALLIVGIAYAYCPVKPMQLSVPMFIIGIVCFSGSLYLYPFLEVKNIAIPIPARMVTPIGGLFFIAGWICALMALLKK